MGWALRVLLLGLLVGLATEVTAKNCKKGKPCGNTCIAWNKTCHVGTSSSTSSSSTSVATRTYNYEPRAELPLECPKGTTLHGTYGEEVWCANTKGTRVGPWCKWPAERKDFWVFGTYSRQGKLGSIRCIDGGFETTCPNPLPE